MFSLNDLAECHRYLKDYEKAKELFEKCYKLMCEVYGEEDEDTIAVSVHLSFCRMELGEYRKKQELLKKKELEKKQESIDSKIANRKSELLQMIKKK